jgi:predicted phosphodiesterase
VPGVGDRDVARAPRVVKIALLSDVHANLPALEAVLRDIDNARIDAVYHLGDLVGYAPWPNEVIDLIRDRAIPGVAGNYDSTVGTDYKHCGCRYEDARQEELSHLSFDWTKRNTESGRKSWLASLPFRIDMRPLGGHASGPTLVLLHGNQALNTVYVTEDRTDDFLRKMGQGAGAREGDVVAFGHTHKPWHRVIDGVQFVNTGSVGRPKDGDWRAGYVILTIGSSGVSPEFRRIDYDVEKAARAIEQSDLPSDFADYLRTGGKPDVATR